LLDAWEAQKTTSGKIRIRNPGAAAGFKLAMNLTDFVVESQT
jgi:hypothetical protein